MLKKIIFLAGPHGVGKTYTTNEIKKGMNILHFDLGPIIRSLHQRNAPDMKLRDWITVGEQRYGSDFSNAILCKEIERSLPENSSMALITGSRSLEGMRYIINYFAIKNPVVIYLDANPSLLKQNYENREHCNVSDETFNGLLLDEQKMGLFKLREYVLTHPPNTFYVINQDNSPNAIKKIRNIITGRQLIAKHRTGSVPLFMKGKQHGK